MHLWSNHFQYNRFNSFFGVPFSNFFDEFAMSIEFAILWFFSRAILFAGIMTHFIIVLDHIIQQQGLNENMKIETGIIKATDMMNAINMVTDMAIGTEIDTAIRNHMRIGKASWSFFAASTIEWRKYLFYKILGTTIDIINNSSQLIDQIKTTTAQEVDRMEVDPTEVDLTEVALMGEAVVLDTSATITTPAMTTEETAMIIAILLISTLCVGMLITIAVAHLSPTITMVFSIKIWLPKFSSKMYPFLD